jgi:hypothetical protein
MRSRSARTPTTARLLATPAVSLSAVAVVWLFATTAGAAQPPNQTHGLRGTARFDAGLYTAYFARKARTLAAGRVRSRAATVLGDEASEAQQQAQEESTGADGEGFGEENENEAPSDGEAPAGDEAPGGAEEVLVFDNEGGAVARAASTSEAGWPAKQCLKMDKGRAGRSHTLVGLDGVHNWLLGGYGNDTIVGGDIGDVIWADYHPSGEPRRQTAVIRAGNGRNVIYANDTRNYVWTGTNPRTVVHAHVSGISGVIHCQSPGIVVYLSTVSQRHFKLDRCRHISHYSVGY